MGNVTLTPEELEALLDRSAKKGAKAALEELGLHDETAAKDIEDIRELLASWRETRKAIWSTVVKIATTGILMFIAGAVWLSIKDNISGQ